MGGFGSPWHWIVILVVAVLLFGNRLPEVARAMGRSVKEFKRGLREVKDQFDTELDDDDPPRRERLQDSAEEHEPAAGGHSEAESKETNEEHEAHKR